MKIKTKPYKNGVKDFTNAVMSLPSRFTDVAKAPDVKPASPTEFNVNKIACSLHPKTQKLVIEKIEDLSEGFKCYTLKAENGKAAYFRAGQYLAFQLKAGSSFCTRAYSIASSPKDALNGIYKIAVKRVDDGFVSGFIIDNWKEGDTVVSYAPEGTFVYEPLRDAKTVIGIAGGSGITPFLSLAKAIDERTENFNLTLLYGARTVKDLAFKDELDRIAEANGNFKVVYVLSEGRQKGFEHGFIGAELIKKYAPSSGDYSIFACGPEAMYAFLGKEVETLGLRRKFVRFEMQGVSKSTPKKAGLTDETCKLTVIDRGNKCEIEARCDETVLTALEKAGIAVPVRCRSGECGFCRSKLLSGEVYIDDGTDYRRLADIQFGYIHPCCTFPKGDITIKIN